MKRQSYFLDYLDPIQFPHLPGSTLFPDPCTFLDNLPTNSYSQLTNEETILITKMLIICYRLYDKHAWNESGKFSDKFELFRLPTLYPQYVFLVQIPFDLMIAWLKYHHDRRMDQTQTTGALLLLIDECKILIHSTTLIRQYVQTMIIDVFEKSELKLIENDLTQFDNKIVGIIQEILGYIERYIDISLRSNLFQNCMILLKDQWKSLKLSDDNYTPGQVTYFFEKYSFINQFSELQNLSLIGLEHRRSDPIFTQLPSLVNLVSLEIKSVCEANIPEIDLPNLKKLKFSSCSSTNWLAVRT